MLRMQCETDVQAPLPVIWRHYVTESLRKKWETDLESLSFDGAVATGTSGTLKLSGKPPIRFVLGRIEENREFSEVVDIPGMGTVEFKHEMFAENGTNHIRKTVMFSPLSGKSGEKEHGFFQQLTEDMAETVFRLKSVVGTAAGAV